MNRFLFVTCFLVVYGFVSLAQDNNASYYIDNRGRDALLAPRIGLGAGVFTYFGDVNDNNYKHIFTSTYGIELLASANLSRYFDLNLTAIYGNITVNERTTERNLNFKSEMFIGGAGVSYNFNHLYKRPGIIQPFIGFGVAFVNFDSKTDKYDANGNLYHFWSNGSIRSLAEDDPLADEESTPVLQRDYVYETDLRDENLDGLGKYDQFTFSLPVTAGIDLKMGRRLSAKLSAAFYYTFTDLIDDISEKGEGLRQGNARNDMFLFTSASISYSIGVGKTYTKSSKTKYYEDVDFYAMRLADSDEDGVNDFDDRCAQTPNGVKVDEHGCPLDSDLDVIEDHRDKEDSTKLGNVVDLDGVTLTDEAMLVAYSDSVATDRARMNEIYPSGILEKNTLLTAGDSTKLAIMMLDLQNQVEQSGEFDKLFDEISKEVFSKTPDQVGSVEDVYSSVEDAYNKLVQEKTISPDKPLTLTKGEQITTSIPPKYKDADYNGDGVLTADEVMRVVEEVLEGASSMNISQLYGLIDFYNEYMSGAKVINFGGTMAIYIDGKLNILENYKRDGQSDNQRYLANKFKAADLNNDGTLTADEVNLTISKFQNGDTTYSKEMINQLIDLFFED